MCSFVPELLGAQPANQVGSFSVDLPRTCSGVLRLGTYSAALALGLGGVFSRGVFVVASTGILLLVQLEAGRTPWTRGLRPPLLLVWANTRRPFETSFASFAASFGASFPAFFPAPFASFVVSFAA